VSDGVLHMTASRHKESREEEQGRFRSEFRYGSFTRSIPLPKGASAQDVKALYRDGILEVTIPVSRAATDKQKVAIARG
jgi:HSP20 family protein